MQLQLDQFHILLRFQGFFSEILDHGPVFEESIYDTLTH